MARRRGDVVSAPFVKPRSLEVTPSSNCVSTSTPRSFAAMVASNASRSRTIARIRSCRSAAAASRCIASRAAVDIL
jgi:hypothetical protein